MIMKKHMTKWNEGDEVMFIDAQPRPTDDKLVRLPAMGEVCTIRKVINSISCDTGDRCVGLYLEGYASSVIEGCGETCYEAERFVPLAWVKALLQQETSFGMGGLPPARQVLHNCLKLFGGHFLDRCCLYHLDHQNGVVDSVVPAPRGPFPFILKFVNDTEFVAESFVPLRVAPEHRPLVAALLGMLNPHQKHGRYRLDPRRHLVEYQLGATVGLKEVNDPGFANFIVNYVTFLAGRVFDPLTEILYRDRSPSESLAKYKLAEAINTAPGAPGVFAGVEKLKQN